MKKPVKTWVNAAPMLVSELVSVALAPLNSCMKTVAFILLK